MPEDEAVRLMTGAYILSGMRIRDEDSLIRIFEGYSMVKKNLPVWDQKLLEGKLRGIRETILRQGRKKFGPPNAEIETLLAKIEDDEHLERLSEVLLTAQNWEELVARPSPH